VQIKSVAMTMMLLASSFRGELMAQEASLAERVDSCIDQRFDAPVDATENLLKELAAAGVAEMAGLETLLRAERANYPDTSDWRGKITKHAIECLHVDYQSQYLLFAPDDLDPDQPLALVVVGHGGNSSMSDRRAEATARAYLQAYRPLADSMNTLIVAPSSTRGWGHIGNSLIFSTISNLKRVFPIDPNRIYITGQSMGGHLSFRAALSLPDRWGAVSPHSGGYDWVEKKSIGNLLNVPGYAIWGKREPFGINKDNRTNAKWGERHGLDWKFVEKNGGHEIYQDELANVAKFFNEHPRDLYRPVVYLRQGGAMKFVKTWQIKGWPEHTVYSDTKPLRWNMRHWIEVEPRTDLKEPQSLLAKNLGDNRFEVTSLNVRQMSLYLHPAMVDLARPVSVTVNGQELFNDKIGSDPALMFNLAREFDDRGRVFWAKIDLVVSNDREVEIPTQQ